MPSSLGLMAAASVHDNAIGIALPDKVTIDNPAVTKALGDAGFKNAITQHVAALGIKTKTVRRDLAVEVAARPGGVTTRPDTAPMAPDEQLRHPHEREQDIHSEADRLPAETSSPNQNPDYSHE